MIRSSSVLTLLYAAGASAAVQAQTAQVSDSSAAAAVVTDYLQGLQFNDTVRLAKAFWPSTKLSFYTLAACILSCIAAISSRFGP